MSGQGIFFTPCINSCDLIRPCISEIGYIVYSSSSFLVGSIREQLTSGSLIKHNAGFYCLFNLTNILQTYRLQNTFL